MGISPLIDEYLETKEELWDRIITEIKKSIIKLFVTRVYMAIISEEGTVHYVDSPAFDQYLYFIQDYILQNFKNLQVGDAAIPFGGISLAFFKVSPKAVIVLHSKGPSGQLLAFKAVMLKWASRIDELIGNIDKIIPPPKPPDINETTPLPKPKLVEPPDTSKIELFEEPEKKPVLKKRTGVYRIPILKKKLTGKEKFPLETIKFMQYCNGTSSIEEIAEKTNVPRLKVDIIIRELIKKGYVKLKRILRS